MAETNTLTGITGGLSFAAKVPTQSEVDQQMVTEYEAYLVDITSLGLAASQMCEATAGNELESDHTHESLRECHFRKR
jgi:hypothetical protein